MAAPQPLHIFQKDIRHLWPETLISLVLFVAFAWAIPYGWGTSEYSPYIKILAGLLHVLMPISWLVVISRLIHDESLVGDRQFWTSRPYHWVSLLAAKVLYLLAFLYLPFFLMQVYLIKHAGLYPSTAMGGLLHNLLLLTVLVVMPITAMAAVTSTFPRLLLSTLGAIIYVLVTIGIVGYVALHSMPAPHLAGIVETLVIALPAVALLYQYATRRTAVSRAILLATPLVILAVLALTPASAMLRHTYPANTEADAPKLTPILAPNSGVPSAKPQTQRGDVLLTLPFSVAGVDKDSSYNLQGVAITADGSGTHFASSYMPTGGSINGAAPYTMVQTRMPLAVFNKLHGQPADLHLSVLTERMKAGAAETWKSTLLPFGVPGHGVCTYPTATEDDPNAGNGPPVCRYAFASPELMLLSANVMPNSCAQPAGPPVPGRAVLQQIPHGLDFDPIVQMPLRLRTADPNPGHNYQLCAGTPLTFLEAKPAGKSRLELDSKQLPLDPYVERVQTVTVGGPPQGAPGPQE